MGESCFYVAPQQAILNQCFYSYRDLQQIIYYFKKLSRTILAKPTGQVTGPMGIFLEVLAGFVVETYRDMMKPHYI